MSACAALTAAQGEQQTQGDGAKCGEKQSPRERKRCGHGPVHTSHIVLESHVTWEKDKRNDDPATWPPTKECGSAVADASDQKEERDHGREIRRSSYSDPHRRSLNDVVNWPRFPWQATSAIFQNPKDLSSTSDFDTIITVSK